MARKRGSFSMEFKREAAMLKVDLGYSVASLPKRWMWGDSALNGNTVDQPE